MKEKGSGLVAAVAAAGLALALAVGVVAWAAGHYTNRTQTITVAGASTQQAASSSPVSVSPEVAAGAHVFVQFACAQCHGPQGQGGVSPYVPALTTVGKQLTEAQLRGIIDHGLGASADPRRPYMPVWGAVISAPQVGELVAYIRAGLPQVATATPPEVPRDQGDAVAGSVLYVVDGCINCHGPNGLGGVPNPKAPDKKIPPLTGVAFRKQFDTKAIVAIIRSGSVIGRAPIVSMPHWGGIISDRDMRGLVVYLKTLK